MELSAEKLDSQGGEELSEKLGGNTIVLVLCCKYSNRKMNGLDIAH